MAVIVFEGINGSGKTEIIEGIRDILVERKQPCVIADPAGFGRIGRILRNQIVDGALKSTPNYDAVLFTALRSEGAIALKEILRVAPSTFVLLERWSLALAAYGHADGARTTLISELRKHLDEILKIDLTLLLDTTGEIAYGRLAHETKKNRFEARGPQYLDQVAQNYRRYSVAEGGVRVVNTSGSLPKSLRAAWEPISRRWSALEAFD
ncbi:MAG: hypothetical protein WAU88_15530 [Candidatus Zixiibacteriota bacterium]